MQALKNHKNCNETMYKKSEEFNIYWPELCSMIATTFNMDPEIKTWLESKNVAKLIAALPFLAGCNKPNQTAAGHLSIYLLSVFEATKSLFHHEEWSDDNEIMRRLQPISNFDGGDPEIFERGMNLLALNMVCGYERDIQKDIFLGKYNPVGEGVWDYSKLKSDLINKIENVYCPEMDRILNTIVGPLTFWGL